MERKGIILAGGSGTRLYPLTLAISKQLLPIYDKPMIYYSITVLMLAGVKNIMIITTPEDNSRYRQLLGDGSQWGIKFSYKIQDTPEGLAHSFILAEEFLNGDPSVMILGDNVFFGHGLPEILNSASTKLSGATIFGYHVSDPERYGVVDFDRNNNVRTIVEKPEKPPSNFAITGLYFVDGTAPERAKRIKKSERGELEITSLLEMYLHDNELFFEQLGRGFAWFDTGTHASMLDASNYVRTVTTRQGLQVGSPDEVAYRLHFISRKQLEQRAEFFKKNEYGKYLLRIAQEDK